jgi:hypothetical protein
MSVDPQPARHRVPSRAPWPQTDLEDDASARPGAGIQRSKPMPVTIPVGGRPHRACDDTERASELARTAAAATYTVMCDDPQIGYRDELPGAV